MGPVSVLEVPRDILDSARLRVAGFYLGESVYWHALALAGESDV